MKKLSIALCGGIVLAGCSSFSERHQASGNFEYLTETDRQAIRVPEGFTPLKKSTEYEIPAVGDKTNKNLVGNKLDIRAPSLIMPVAPNSLISSDSNSTQVVFESFLSQDKFKDDLWQKVASFVESQGYGVGSEQEGHSLLTRAIVSDEYFMLLFGLDDDSKLSQQYQFTIDVEPQGHKASVSVELVDHQEQDQEVELNTFAKRRYEARMLNHFLSQVYVEHNKKILANRLKAKKGIKLELGFDNEQNTVYQIHAPFELSWEKLAVVLPRLGFIVDDRDKSVNTYFTHFEPIDEGFWAGLFSSDSEITELDLKEDEKYQVKLAKQGELSLLSVIDSNGERLSAEQMKNMLNGFRELMAEKQL